MREREEAAQRVVYLITLLCFEVCGILSSWNISASSRAHTKKKKVHVPPASLLPAQHSSRTDCDSYFATLPCPFYSTPGYSFVSPLPLPLSLSLSVLFSCLYLLLLSFSFPVLFSRPLKASSPPCSSIRHLISKCPVPPCHRRT